MRQSFQAQTPPGGAQAAAHGRQTLSVQKMWQEVLPLGLLQSAHQPQVNTANFFVENIFSGVKYFLAASHIFCAGSPRASRVSRSLARVLGPAAARWRPRPPPARAPTWHQTRRDHCRWCPVSRPVPLSPGTKGHKLETRLPHCRQHWQLSPPGLVGMQPLVLSGLLSPRASLRSSHEISQ